jgi:hypothetical protein
MTYISTKISTDDSNFSLDALYNPTKDAYEMVSLTIYNDDCTINEIWDNSEYLINTIYPYLLGNIEDLELDKIISNYKKELLEIFNIGISMKFFKDTLIV